MFILLLSFIFQIVFILYSLSMAGFSFYYLLLLLKPFIKFGNYTFVSRNIHAATRIGERHYFFRITPLVGIYHKQTVV